MNFLIRKLWTQRQKISILTCGVMPTPMNPSKKNSGAKEKINGETKGK